MTLVIGITGGIGSGKSTFSKYLKKADFLVHEADSFVSRMYRKPNKDFLEFLSKSGFKIAIKNNKIDKKLITQIIFNNTLKKKKIEKYIHKQVHFDRLRYLKKNKKNKNKAIFFDIPLLLENKLENNFDLVICVLSTKKNRTERVLKNKKFSKEVLKKIFKLQVGDKDRRSRSNIIINNNKTKKHFFSLVKQLLIKVLK